MNNPIINKYGDQKWYHNGQLHRTDGPAVECTDGYKEWWVNGQLHRTDGPAVEYSDGGKAWYHNGQLHRTDGPAVECSNDRKAWCINGEQIDINNLLIKITNPNYKPTKLETTILEHLIKHE